MAPEQSGQPVRIFVSYAREDGAYRSELLAHLAVQRHLQLVADPREQIADWHDGEVIPGGHWDREIRQQLDTADIIVALLSSDFFNSEYIKRVEIPRALERDADGGAHVVPVVVRPVAWKPTPFGKLAGLPPNGQPVELWGNRDEAWVKVVEGLQRTVAAIAARRAGGAPAGGASHLGATPTGFFTGRDQELAAIRDALAPSAASGTRVHALSGLGGSGKTQTALEYVRRYHAHDSNVFWIRGDSAETIADGLAAIARQKQLLGSGNPDHQRAVAEGRRWLADHDTWLLVVDNLDSPDLLRGLLPLASNGRILLTSRAQIFQSIGEVTVTTLENLSRDDAEAFLLRRTGRTLADPSERRSVAALAEELAFPLALEQAAAYIAEHQVRFDDYLQSYRERRLTLLEKMVPIAGDHVHSLRTTLAMACSALDRWPASADLLRLSAFLHADAIPLELLTKACDVVGEAIRHALGPNPSPIDVDELITPLTQRSLVRKNNTARCYAIHRLVQDVVRAGLSPEEHRTWLERAVRAVVQALPDPKEFAAWTQCDRLLLHARACAEQIRARTLELDEASELMNWLGVYAKEHAQYADAKDCYRYALMLRERKLHPQHPKIADVAHNLAEMYWHVDRFAEAEQLYQRALAIRELPPIDPRKLAATLSYLAYLHYSKGDYPDAETLHLRALEIRRTNFGPDDPDVGTSLNNLGRLYLKQARFRESEACFVDALRIREQRLPPDHFHTAYTLNGLANLYCRQRDYAKAEPLYRRAIDIVEAALGPTDPRMARVLDGLARLYRETGRHAEAKIRYRQAIDIVTAVHGADSRFLPDLLEGLAAALVAADERSEADRCLVLAAAIRAKRAEGTAANAASALQT